MPAPPLPTSRVFVTQLLESLSSNALLSSNDAANSDVLSHVSETTKKHLLSLQVLFPNEFLPALDLIDRGLVTRLVINTADGQVAHSNGPNPESSSIALGDATKQNTIYYVRSAQQRTSRFTHSYNTTTFYEVRLLAWNCSCPAFAFAAFPSVHPEPAIPDHNNKPQLDQNNVQKELEKEWVFGGVSLGESVPPVCKHLLACVLVERCTGLFGNFVEERQVGIEEAAGWAAGWGD